jgi:pyridinium-3,5-biscarboxylic acid mononucleotide sulfurtransferase
MPESLTDPLRRLEETLASMDRVAVAVSGGVDSLTLATLAHDALGRRARMHHATSPAVPEEATNRTRAVARERGWSLDVFDAGEFADARYRANPVNRCFFCKINLYGAIARRTDAQILSGTNLDDLGEYRPGLDAAKDHGVRHPFVEAGIGKTAIRGLAARAGLGAISDLPAAPCLSSRVETGIAIQPPMLAMIDRAERLLRAALSPRTVRCRVRAAGVVIELDAETLGRMDAATEGILRSDLLELAAANGVTSPVSFATYRNGSAFLRAGA